MRKSDKKKRIFSMAMVGILTAGCLATVVQATEHEHVLAADLVVEATCLTDGFTVYICEEPGCGYSVKSDYVGASHVEEVVPGVPASCTTAGLTDGVKCSSCGEILVAQEEISASHTLVASLVVEPTCSKSGYTVYECEEPGCGYSVKDNYISGGSHTEEVIPGMAASCTTAGLTDGVKCSVCGEILVAQEEISASHALVAGLVVEPTCSKGGYTVYECEVPGCGYSVKGDYTDVGSHTEKVVAGKEASCTEAGLTDGSKCSVCGEILAVQTEIPETGHTEEVVAGMPATCTEAGLTEGSKCSVCGEILVAQTEIPAVGHTEEVIPGKEATCTEEGLTEGAKCSVCGEILAEQEVISKEAHDLTLVEAKDPTETTEGNKAYYVCSVCGKLYEDATGLVETTMENVKLPVVPPTVPEEDIEDSTEEDAEEDIEDGTEEDIEEGEEEDTENDTEEDTAAENTASNGNNYGKSDPNTVNAASFSEAPDTGDHTNIALYVLALLLSGGEIMLLFRKMRAVK